jgi:hypothetical protein
MGRNLYGYGTHYRKGERMKIDAIYDDQRYLKLEADPVTARELMDLLSQAYEGKEMPELINKIVFWIEEEITP